MRGVKPLFTSSRYRVCFGGSMSSMSDAARVERHVGVFTDRELARHDHRAADLRRERRGVAVHLDEVGVLHDVPVAAALEVVGLPVHGVLGPEPSEHLVVLESLEAFGVVEVDALDRRCVPWGPPRSATASRLFDLMNHFGPTGPKLSSAQQGRHGDRRQVAAGRGRRGSPGSASTVPAWPKCRLTIGPAAPPPACVASPTSAPGIVVVERVDVEAEHGARSPPRPRPTSTCSPGDTVPSSVPDGRNAAPGPPVRRTSTSRQRTISSSCASRDSCDERRVRVGVVGELVTAVGDARRHVGVGVEPVADDERRHRARGGASSTSSSWSTRPRSPLVWKVSATRSAWSSVRDTTNRAAGAWGGVGVVGAVAAVVGAVVAAAVARRRRRRTRRQRADAGDRAGEERAPGRRRGAVRGPSCRVDSSGRHP